MEATATGKGEETRCIPTDFHHDDNYLHRIHCILKLINVSTTFTPTGYSVNRREERQRFWRTGPS